MWESIYSSSLHRALPKWERFFLLFIEIFKVYLSSQGWTWAICEQLGDKTGRNQLLPRLTKIAKCLMAKSHTHPCSAWLEQSCATASHQIADLGYVPVHLSRQNYSTWKTLKKNPLEYCNCPSSHVNCLTINRKLLGGTGRAPVPALPPSLPFLLQIKPPPLISSTSFSGWLFFKLTLLTQSKAGSSALWLTTFFWQRKSTMNNLFWRLSKKQSKKVSAGLGNFLCTGSLIKAGDRKQ